MKKLLVLIITTALFVVSTAVIGAEYFSTKNGEFVKIKGILKLNWEPSEEKEGCRLYNLDFFSENKKDFGGDSITLFSVDMDYYNSGYVENDSYGEEKYNTEQKEKEKILKTLIPDKNDNFWKQEKGTKQIPVEVTLNLAHIKTYTECDYTSIYSKIEKIEKLKEKDVKKRDFSETETIFYTVYSKDGYANMRKKPENNSEIIRKLENETELHYILSVGEWDYFYKNGYYDDESYGGFVHRSQVEKMYSKVMIDSKDGYGNIRSEASADSKILKKVKNGQIFEKHGIKGEWIEIWYETDENKGVYAYIHRSQIRILE